MKALYSYDGFVKVPSYEGHIKFEKGLVYVDANNIYEACEKIGEWLAKKHYVDTDDVIIEVEEIPTI